jgi:hydrogenase nickel incorporation protein HypA/HybF
VHELGVVMEVVKMVEQYAAEQDACRIESLTLEIGELSSAIPSYVEAVYPAAVSGSILEGAELKIEIIPCCTRCKNCEKIFNALEHKAVCPVCGGKELELLSGKEFHIKEIAVIFL